MIAVTKQDVIDALIDLGLKSDDEIEVHSALSSFALLMAARKR